MLDTIRHNSCNHGCVHRAIKLRTAYTSRCLCTTHIMHSWKRRQTNTRECGIAQKTQFQQLQYQGLKLEPCASSGIIVLSQTYSKIIHVLWQYIRGSEYACNATRIWEHQSVIANWLELRQTTMLAAATCMTNHSPAFMPTQSKCTWTNVYSIQP